MAIDKLKLEVVLSAIDKLSRPLSAARGKSRELAQAIKQTQDRIKALDATQERLASGKLPLSTESLTSAMRESAAEANRLNATLAEQQRKLGAINEEMRRQQSITASAEKIGQTRDRLASSGAWMTAAGAGILYAGNRMIAPGFGFEEEMSSVQALTRLTKASAALEKLKTQARELGATTTFTATDVAQGQGFLAMAGFDPKSILDAMPGMLNLSKAGRTDLAQTADIASNILTGFKLNADQSSRMADVLVGTFTRANVNLQMLGDTMKYVAPVAASLGVDIETAAAMTGKLGDAGVQGSMAGTALRAILSRLAAPPRMAAKALQELNISAQDARGNLRGLPDILEELNKKTAKMGDARRVGLFKHIAGEEAANGLTILVNKAGSGELKTMIETLRAY